MNIIKKNAQQKVTNTLKRLEKLGKIVKATAGGVGSTIMAENRRIRWWRVFGGGGLGFAIQYIVEQKYTPLLQLSGDKNNKRRNAELGVYMGLPCCPIGCHRFLRKNVRELRRKNGGRDIFGGALRLP